MKTVIEDMRQGLQEEGIKRAGEVIKRGGLVAFPTETVYGLGANALDPEASEKIYSAKGRPSDNPLIVHIADWEKLNFIVRDVPEAARRLGEAFWPGPLTMIFRRKETVPLTTTGGLDTVAVRMPDHPVALGLIRAGGGYIAAPSANTSGRPSPTKASHVLEDMDGIIDMIIDGGDVGIGLESTIVDFTEEMPVILRPGYINQNMIQEVIGEVRMDQALIDEHSSVRPKAPGMKYRHYAPKAQLYIVEGAEEEVRQKIDALAEQEERRGRRAGVIVTEESVPFYHHGILKVIGSRGDELSISRHLFGILREFDEMDVQVIYSEAFHTPQMGQAIMNRLLKAAGHQIIKT
ncbi:MAG TPA: threonylcarbamoyl-AMP synthase [Candidatus Choladousia intestinavium]|uniref:Threonylcarbamoyl-AMP synthase n=1 Tax=Candidatus Choladousia intestinavium TaxID=2840727 RepID=A0A9D1D9S6_9FIRM|nr:threonylcarbamoyl-AMP synthase [Candidatus Choladousia intestinavium]